MRYLSTLRRDLILTKLLELGVTFIVKTAGGVLQSKSTVLLLFYFTIGFMEQYRPCWLLVFQLRDWTGRIFHRLTKRRLTLHCNVRAGQDSHVRHLSSNTVEGLEWWCPQKHLKYMVTRWTGLNLVKSERMVQRSGGLTLNWNVMSIFALIISVKIFIRGSISRIERWANGAHLQLRTYSSSTDEIFVTLPLPFWLFSNFHCLPAMRSIYND